jgi:hypothetical protein
VVLDSVLLFGISHSLETSSGPLLVTAGLAYHWPEWLTTLLGLGGAVISVPGLDPLCIAIFGIYSQSPHFRYGVGKIRAALVWGTKTVSDKVGLTAALRNIFVRPDYKEWLSEIENLDELRELKDGRLVAQYSYPSISEPRIKFEVEVGKGRPYLKRIFVDPRFSYRDSRLVVPWLKKFGWNTRDFISQFVLKNVLINGGGEKAYVEKIERKGRWQVITLLDSAIRMGPAVAIAPPTGGVCRAIFSR